VAGAAAGVGAGAAVAAGAPRTAVERGAARRGGRRRRGRAFGAARRQRRRGDHVDVGQHGLGARGSRRKQRREGERCRKIQPVSPTPAARPAPLTGCCTVRQVAQHRRGQIFRNPSLIDSVAHVAGSFGKSHRELLARPASRQYGAVHRALVNCDRQHSHGDQIGRPESTFPASTKLKRFANSLCRGIWQRSGTMARQPSSVKKYVVRLNGEERAQLEVRRSGC
jgi:hypothetical protein